jgi:hypothetical protein
LRVMARSFGEGSSPIVRAVERQVESRTNADLGHASGGGWDDPTTIISEIALPHRQTGRSTTAERVPDRSPWSGMLERRR